MKRIINIAIVAIVAIVFFLSGCLRLDSNLFNNVALTKYSMDATTEKQEITLDNSYKIEDSLIHLLQLTSDDNGDKAIIYAEYLGSMNRIGTDTIIMYFHGTAHNMDFYWNRTKLLANIGSKNRYGVMTIDYRGYGMSQGTPTESGMYADANAALNWLHDNGLTGDRLIVYGFSLGSAPATKWTANPGILKPSKLILESPFASAAVMVQDASVLALPPSYFTNLKIDNGQEIKKVMQPFMWMHGIDDAFLNIKTHGEVVYKNYQGVYSEAHRIVGGTHSNVPVAWGLENYKSCIEAFILH